MSVILNFINYFWKLGFNEEEPDLYVKEYLNSYRIGIDMVREIINYGEEIGVADDSLSEFSQKNFVIMESIDRLLRKGYSPGSIHLSSDPSFDCAVDDGDGEVLFAIRCRIWEDEYDEEVQRLRNDPGLISSFFDTVSSAPYLCIYTSRLKAGTIECRYTVFPRQTPTAAYDHGIFEEDQVSYHLVLRKALGDESATGKTQVGDFLIQDDLLIRYSGDDSEVVIPDIVRRLRNAVFWNASEMERVIIPDHLVSMGGDTFYNCANLKELTIPRGVTLIGDNPFANCPHLELINESPNFVIADGALYDQDKKRLIYCSIKREGTTFRVPDGVISIAKHAFYNCRNLRTIIIPPSAKIMENNPFSNLPDLRLKNNSPHFVFRDGALYNKTMSTLFYYEHQHPSGVLVIPEGVSIIGRHSFYNCKTIKSITIPSSVRYIGYNPFTNCDSLSLLNESPNYVLEKGALYDSTMSELIYYSIPNPATRFVVPDSVEKIGRSAFFGCKNIEQVVLPESLKIVERSAFANCARLGEINIPVGVSSLGEWAFYNCPSLKEIMLPGSTSVESQTFLDCPAQISQGAA